MPEGISLPSAPPATPGLPENFTDWVLEVFETLNTRSLRPGLKDGELAWCDGWLPFGPNNLRILPGTGPVIFTATGGLGVDWFGFGNIGDTPYMTALLSDGSIHWVNTQTTGTGTLMPPGTITSPSNVMGASQWGSLYLIFAKDQTNGYWLWDGTNLFTAGTVAPDATITNGGSGYTSAPAITVHTTGSGTGAAFVSTIQAGVVIKISATNPGSGFANGDLVSLTFSGGGSDDQAIAGNPVISTTSGGLAGYYITNGGSGYTSRASASFSGGGGSGASATLAIQNGVITAAAIVAAGTGYTSAPTVTVTDPGIPGTPPIPGGSGASGGVFISFGQITSIPVSYGGSGYVSPPTVKIDGDGTGATAIANISSGQVTSITMTNMGSGYTTAIVTLTGGNDAANAAAFLMPFGVSGTTVEVFQSRVWVSNGGASSNIPTKNRTIFSSPSSPFDFGDGGGAFQSFDSFLRVGFHSLKQTNGFLYLIGDSSINYISGVQTSTASLTPITTFSNQNVDPQLGTPWASSVQVFSRNIVFANSIGIFVSYGGAVTKVSEPLDGFYGTGPIFGAQSNFSSAIATILGIPVYMLLLPVVDQFTGQPATKLLMWTGKRWFTSDQDRAMTYIASQEINSVLTAYGTDGTKIFPLFQNPSVGFTKVVQSKLFANPSYFATKAGLRLHGIVNYFAVDNPLVISIDNENGVGSGNAKNTIFQLPIDLSWSGITWTNGGGVGVPLTWSGAGLSVFGPYPAGQAGRLIGMTVLTTASNLALLSVTATGQTETINV